MTCFWDQLSLIRVQEGEDAFQYRRDSRGSSGVNFFVFLSFFTFYGVALGSNLCTYLFIVLIKVRVGQIFL